MKIGRNDPCPCGSGMKYKKCCYRSRAVAAPTSPSVTPGTGWEADILPVSIHFDDDPTSRPALLLVTAGDDVGGAILGHDLLARPSAEADDMAADLAREVRAVIDQFGQAPRSLTVPDRDTAAALQPLLADLDIRVVAGPAVAVDNAWLSFQHDVAGNPEPEHLAAPTTWAGWGQPEAWTARMFEAIARWVRAETGWRRYLGLDLTARAPSGRKWFFGAVRDDDDLGLLLGYDVEPWDDAELLHSSIDPFAFGSPFRRVFSLQFFAASDLRRAARREILDHGWTVADARSHPMLTAVATPAGGLRRPDPDDLLALIETFARLTEEAPGVHELAEGWTDPESGIEVRIGDAGVEPIGAPPPTRLSAGFAEGADPESALALGAAAREDPSTAADEDIMMAIRAMVDDFRRRLESKGRAESTIAKHGQNAEEFLAHLWAFDRVTVVGLHEIHLWHFLYKSYPFQHPPRGRSAAMRASLRELFEFLDAEMGLLCLWAEPLLRDKATFEQRLSDVPDPWDESFPFWLEPLATALDARVFLPSPGLGEDRVWLPPPRGLEARLRYELGCRWLMWRDEVIAEGETDPEIVRDLLIDRQLEWELTPHPDLDGRTPFDAILDERDEREADTDI